MTSDARKDGSQRLDAALRDQDRLRERFQSALGTASEFGAFTRLESAREVVSARQDWLDHCDEEIASAVEYQR
jgi:hypothetical protein